MAKDKGTIGKMTSDRGWEIPRLAVLVLVPYL
jgi:hypothetical protein